MKPNAMLQMALALSLQTPAGFGPPQQTSHQPYNVGRNKEKAALRLAKAEAKRRRKQDRNKEKEALRLAKAEANRKP